MKGFLMDGLRKRFVVFGLAALLCMAMVLGFLGLAPVVTQAAKMDLVYLPFQIDGGETVQIAAYESNYEYNYFLSLRSLAKALVGTPAQFNFYNDADGFYQVETGMPYDASLEPKEKPETDGEGEESAETAAPAASEEKKRDTTPAQSTWLEFANNWLYVDGHSVNYFNYADYNIEDLFMSLLDCQMMLDLHIVRQDGVYVLNTADHFEIDLDALNQRGYFDYLHGVAVGDASTGQLFMSCHGQDAVPIGSTTKLMTYLVAKRMVEIGRITEDDVVTISANAARLSVADDGIIGMAEGQQTTVRDLMDAMLIVSSNESALALAEYVGGSEGAFVEMMNSMAAKLGLNSAIFYNPHGLPTFLPGDVVIMVENRMSAEDMFRLARTILLKYPEIEEITSTKELWIESLWTTVNTTNQLLDNLPDVFGLKTGTTDAAMKCLVSSRRVQVNGAEHLLVGVVFGAEFNSDRVQVSELLLRGAERYLKPAAPAPADGAAPAEGTAEGAAPAEGTPAAEGA